MSERSFMKLGDLTKDSCFVSIFAVVKYFTKPKASKGTDKSFFVTVVDPTLYEHEASLKCIFFEKDDTNFPVISNVGDVVKFTSLSISEFNGQLQGKGCTKNGFSWVTFDGRPNVPVDPRFSQNSCKTLNDKDRKEVEELKLWASTIPELYPLSQRMTLEQLTPRHLFFDFLCQIVWIEVFEIGNMSCILHVWDGTVPGVASVISSNKSFCTTTKWGDKVFGKTVKIYVYPKLLNMISAKPGNYILITNLHLKSKEEVVENETKIVYFLVLHEGKCYGRGISLMSEDDPDVRQLVARMEASLTATTLTTTETSRAAQAKNLDGVYKYPRPTFFALKVAKEVLDKCSACEFLTPQVTCIGRLKVSQNVPGLFLVKARVYAYWPKNVKEFVKYGCRNCKRYYEPKDIAEVCKGQVQPTCLTDDCGKSLSLTLFFSFILRDLVEFIDVVVANNDAKIFFPDVDPVALYNDNDVQEWLEKRLACLLQPAVWVEYVIVSFNSQLTAKDGQPIPVYCVTETRFPLELESRLKHEETVKINV